MQAIPKWIWILSLGATVTLAVILSWACSTSRAAVDAEPLIEVEAEPSPQAPADWRIGQPVTYETLTVFPVLSSQEASTDAFETLDAALASGEAVVTEQGDAMRRSRNGDAQPIPYVSSGAQVNQLVLINRGNKPLLLLAGEVVSGGKQDRIIAKDRIIPIGAKPLPLDVFCVEHSRWTNGDAKFSAARTMVHPTVREKAAIDSDQTQVWAAVRGDTAAAMEQRDMASNLEVTPPPISSQQLSRLMASAAPTEGYRSIYQSAAVGPVGRKFCAGSPEAVRACDFRTQGRTRCRRDRRVWRRSGVERHFCIVATFRSLLAEVAAQLRGGSVDPPCSAGKGVAHRCARFSASRDWTRARRNRAGRLSLARTQRRPLG